MRDDRMKSASQKSETYISPYTHITGSLDAENTIVFDGRIDGNLSSQGDLRITGTVVGNVSGQDIIFAGGKVKGDVFARGDIKGNADTIIVGDVSGQNIDFNGSCKGNLIIENIVTLRNEALVVGNIRSLTVGIETGAAIRGELQSTSERDVNESLFESI